MQWQKYISSKSEDVQLIGESAGSWKAMWVLDLPSDSWLCLWSLDVHAACFVCRIYPLFFLIFLTNKDICSFRNLHWTCLNTDSICSSVSWNACVQPHCHFSTDCVMGITTFPLPGSSYRVSLRTHLVSEQGSIPAACSSIPRFASLVICSKEKKKEQNHTHASHDFTQYWIFAFICKEKYSALPLDGNVQIPNPAMCLIFRQLCWFVPQILVTLMLS